MPVHGVKKEYSYQSPSNSYGQAPPQPENRSSDSDKPQSTKKIVTNKPGPNAIRREDVLKISRRRSAYETVPFQNTAMAEDEKPEKPSKPSSYEKPLVATKPHRDDVMPVIKKAEIARPTILRKEVQEVRSQPVPAQRSYHPVPEPRKMSPIDRVERRPSPVDRLSPIERKSSPVDVRSGLSRDEDSVKETRRRFQMPPLVPARPEKRQQQQQEELPLLQNPAFDDDAKRDLKKINAIPIPRMMANDAWIKPAEPERKGPRRSEIMRKETTNIQDHWMVQEAERRRLADRNKEERMAKLQSRQTAGDDLYRVPARSYEDLNRLAAEKDNEPALQPKYPLRPSTHVMEHVERPDSSRPSRPIPDDIKQTLISRVAAPKGSNGSSSPSAQSPSNLPHPNYANPGYGQYPEGAYPYQPQPSPTDQMPPVRSTLVEKVAPAKPPRKISSGEPGEEDDAGDIVSVSGKKKCSHCSQELGETPSNI